MDKGKVLKAFGNVQKITSYDFTSSLLHHLFGWISPFVLTASSSVTTRQSLNKFISALAVSSVLAMAMTEQAHHCSSGLTKTLDFILRFLAMAMTEQAHHCSSGLTKTLDFSICSVTIPASLPYKYCNITQKSEAKLPKLFLSITYTCNLSILHV